MSKIVNWKTFFILLGACVIGSVLVIPFQVALSPALSEFGAMLYVSALIQGLIIFSIASFFGLILARKVGFSLPILEGDNKIESLRNILGPSILWGVIGGVLIVLVALPFGELSFEMLMAETAVPMWASFLASFYGGIAEEVLMRLFIMSLLAWILIKIRVPKNISIWIAIIVSAIVFGLGHLPLTGELTTITTVVVARAVLLNGVGAIIFSLLYWKKGLESATIAHFSADIVLHVIVPLVAKILS